MADQATPRQSRISKSNCREAGALFQKWEAILEQHQTIEDALAPRFWINMAPQMQRGARIEVLSHDYTSGWTLQVVETGKDYVKTIMRSHAEMQQPVLPASSPLEWKWNASLKMYDVVRKDGTVLSSGQHQTKQAAKDWIDRHNRDMAA